ncbi:MAG TPA: alpha/beta hydrolase [Candidatus Eisenbacteria bacterium]|nr:alpha/beta hydrolase [Candidatus Eisenbacteria bacterium]
METHPASAPKSPSRLWRITKRIFLGLLLLLVIAAISGIAYQKIFNARDASRYPQEGRSVPLGPEFPGVSLNLNCTGSGSPTVVLDTGLGVPAVGWDLVQPTVASYTRVCSYDRAGYGWSTPGPMPRTSEQIVKELHALLTAAGEKGPYILVAHSFGGFNVRIYTSKYPADVVGLVLVDTSHEDQNHYLPASLQAVMKNYTQELETERKLFPALLFFGVARLMATDDLSSPRVDHKLLKKIGYLELQSKAVDAAASEMENFDQSAAEVRTAGNLGDRPLIVLSAGQPQDPKDLPKGVSLKDMQDFQKFWIADLQVREKNLSTRGKQIVVTDSSHMIPFFRPDLVISAIREVYDAAQTPPATVTPPGPAGALPGAK